MKNTMVCKFGGFSLDKSYLASYSCVIEPDDTVLT